MAGNPRDDAVRAVQRYTRATSVFRDERKMLTGRVGAQDGASPRTGLAAGYLWVHDEAGRREERVLNPLGIATTASNVRVWTAIRTATGQREVTGLEGEDNARNLGDAITAFVTPDKPKELFLQPVPTANLTSFRARPSSLGGLYITIEEGWYYNTAGALTFRPKQNDLDLAAVLPSSGQHRYALVSLDRSDGAYNLSTTTARPVTLPLSKSDIETAAALLDSDRDVKWAIPLTGGQTGYTTTRDWVDLRAWGTVGVAALPDIPSAFTDLTDTPASYSEAALKPVRVNAAGDGLDFAPYTWLFAFNRWFASSGINYEIDVGFGTSPDDLVVTHSPAIGKTASWKTAEVKDARLLVVDGVIWLFYVGTTGSALYSIGVAHSFDGGATWVDYASNPILTPSGSGYEAQGGSSLIFPAVLYDRDEADPDKRWKMWFGAGKFGGGGIGYATSPDGVTWTKQGQVYALGTTGAWDDAYQTPGAVVKVGDRYHMWLNGKHGSAWSSGLVTFTDPEGTYTPHAANPLLVGDGKTTALTSTVSVGATTVAVSDATLFPVGAAVWVGTTGNHYLTHVVARPSTTSLVMADPAPVSVSSGDAVRSVAYQGVDITDALWDGAGWRLACTGHQPGYNEPMREVSFWAWADADIERVVIDYTAGAVIPVDVTDSTSNNVSAENPAVIPLAENVERWRGKRGESGTVSSVGLSLPSEFTVTGSPVTTSGTLTATKANQSANTVYAAPDGSTGAPTFRALTLADIPVSSIHAGDLASHYEPVAYDGALVFYLGDVVMTEVAN